jgi:hypothetical protein
VDARFIHNVLPEGVYGGEGEEHCLQGIDACFGASGGVSRFAEELDLQSDAGQSLGGGGIMCSRVHHHRHVYVIKSSPLRHYHLAPVELLGGRADNQDAASTFVDSWLGSHGGTDGTAGYQIMTTGMPQLGQGIILSQNGDSWFAVSVSSLEGGR